MFVPHSNTINYLEKNNLLIYLLIYFICKIYTMPIKLGLVLTQRQNITFPNVKQQQPPVQPIVQPEQKGLTLRRVMNAPKTGCKSCGG